MAVLPRWLFLAPGSALFGLGLAVSLWLLAGPRRIAGAELDIHTLLIAGLAFAATIVVLFLVYKFVL